MPHVPPGHRRVGWTAVPKTGRGSFMSSASDKPKVKEFLDRTELGEGLRQLEDALGNGNAPQELVRQLDKGFRYAGSLPSKELPPEYGRLYRRFYALAEVHGFADGQRKSITPPSVKPSSTTIEVVEAGLGILQWDETPRYIPSQVLVAIEQLRAENPEGTFDLLSDNMEKVLNYRGVRAYLSHVRGIPPEKVGFLHVLEYFRLLPAHMQTRDKPRYDA